MKLKTILTTIALAISSAAVDAAPLSDSQGDLRLLHKYDETNSALEGHTTRILQDRDGLIWIATWNGIYRFDGYEFRRLKPGPDDSCSMTSDRIRDIWLAKDGNFFVQNDNRLYHFDSKTYRFRNLRDSTEQQEALSQRDNQPSRGITINGHTAYTDPQGLEWIADDGTLYCMSRMEQPIKPLPMEQPAMVRCLKLDSSKRVWVTTKEDGTVRLLDGEGNLIGYMAPDGTLSTSYKQFGHSVYCITETSDGKIWLGAKPDGLFRLTPAGDKDRPRFNVEHIEGLSNDRVYAIAEDSQKRLWVATLGGGIACVESIGDAQPKILNDLPGYPKETCQRVRHIIINKKGILLACTTEGLIVAKVEDDPLKMEFRQHTRDAQRATSLSCNATMDIVETVEGRLFVCTETGGISEITSSDLLADTLGFRHYDIASGLMPTDMTLGMTLMPNGRLLVTGNAKLIKLDVVDNSFETLCHHFFQHVHHFSEARPLLMPSGQWLVATLDGAFMLPVSAAHHTSYQPPLLFTKVAISNQKPRLAVTHIDTLRLKPSERSLTISFAALDYVDPYAVAYQYRFASGDSGVWNTLGHSHALTLLDLAPGTYTLTIRSTNADGVWTDNTRQMTIIVEPLFSETVWARALMIILLIAAAAGGAYAISGFRHRKQSAPR